MPNFKELILPPTKAYTSWDNFHLFGFKDQYDAQIITTPFQPFELLILEGIKTSQSLKGTTYIHYIVCYKLT